MDALKNELEAVEVQVASMDAFYESEAYRALPDENKRIFDEDRARILPVRNMLRRRFEQSQAALG